MARPKINSKIALVLPIDIPAPHYDTRTNKRCRLTEAMQEAVTKLVSVLSSQTKVRELSQKAH